METGDCGDALLFLWAFQITDSDREDSLNVWSSNLWEWTCQQLIVVPQVCGISFVRTMPTCFWMRLKLQKCSCTSTSCGVVIPMPFATSWQTAADQPNCRKWFPKWLLLSSWGRAQQTDGVLCAAYLRMAALGKIHRGPAGRAEPVKWPGSLASGCWSLVSHGVWVMQTGYWEGFAF